MRLSRAHWALLGLAVLLAAGYFLNRGVLVGSKIETAKLSDAYPVPFYKKHCRYPFFNGIQQVWTRPNPPGRGGKKLLRFAQKRTGDPSAA